jgi:hypothetical protein
LTFQYHTANNTPRTVAGHATEAGLSPAHKGLSHFKTGVYIYSEVAGRFLEPPGSSPPEHVPSSAESQSSPPLSSPAVLPIATAPASTGIPTSTVGPSGNQSAPTPITPRPASQQQAGAPTVLWNVTPIKAGRYVALWCALGYLRVASACTSTCADMDGNCELDLQRHADGSVAIFAVRAKRYIITAISSKHLCLIYDIYYI